MTDLWIFLNEHIATRVGAEPLLWLPIAASVVSLLLTARSLRHLKEATDCYPQQPETQQQFLLLLSLVGQRLFLLLLIIACLSGMLIAYMSGTVYEQGGGYVSKKMMATICNGSNFKLDTPTGGLLYA